MFRLWRMWGGIPSSKIINEIPLEDVPPPHVFPIPPASRFKEPDEEVNNDVLFRKFKVRC